MIDATEEVAASGGWQMPSYDDYLRAKYPREPEPEPEISPEPPKPFAPVEIDLPPLGEIAVDPLAALQRAIYAAQRPRMISFRRPPHVDTDDEEILLLM